MEPVTVGELQARPGSVHEGPAPLAALSWHPQAEVLALGTRLFILDPWGLSSPRVQVAGTAGTDGPSAGPSASSHTACLESTLAWPYLSLFLEETQSQLLGLGPLRTEQSCCRDVAGEGGCEGGGLLGRVPGSWIPRGHSPVDSSCASLTQVPLSFPFVPSEHLWKLCPGPDGPSGLPLGEGRKGRPGHPWCARL